MLLSMVTVVGLVCGLGFAAYSTVEIPAFDSDIRHQTTTVYYAPTFGDASDRGAKIGDFPGVKREIIDCADIPKNIQDAVVAAEDQSFYDNLGIDPRGIARALYYNLKGGNRQGASTLTQQYVKNYYGGSRTGYMGKAQEALLAVKIAQEIPKPEILCQYLNTIFWGRGQTHGIQAASKAYFGIEAKDLDLSQAVMLAGIIPSPARWDPVVNPEKAKQRWDNTLQNMLGLEYITESQKSALTFPEMCPVDDETGAEVSDGHCVIAPAPSAAYEGPKGYLMDMARQEAALLVGIPQEELTRGGYSIITTIDEQMQTMALESAASMLDGTLAGKPGNPAFMPSQCDPNDDPECPGMLRLAMVTLDPNDGAIRSLYSGDDFIKDQYNRVTLATIQAGSTFKPFTLVAALQAGKSLNSVYSGASPQTFANGTWPVNNFGYGSYGNMNLVEATANSVNTVYAALNMEVGPENTAAVATKAGIRTQVSVVPSNVLGSDAVHPLDMAQAYGVFAAGGRKATPHIVARVVSPSGQVWNADTRTENVFDAGIMADTVAALRGPVTNGSASEYVKPIGRTIAGKTGTSSDNKSAWFIGFTTDLVTAVGLSQEGPGNAEVSITRWGGVKQVTGGSWPAALWADYMGGCGGKKTRAACSGGVLAMPQYATDTKFPPPVYGGVASIPPPGEDDEDEDGNGDDEPVTIVVPSLAGRNESEASGILVGMGFQVNIVVEQSELRPSMVVRLDPPPGTELPLGEMVTVVVSSGQPPAGGGPGG